MTTRYFKATDGVLTVFRASKTRVYGSAKHEPSISWTAGTGLPMPAVEISKAEYNYLVERKARRIACDWEARNRADWGDYDHPPRWWGNSPQDSYVRNGIDIPAAAGDATIDQLIALDRRQA